MRRGRCGFTLLELTIVVVLAAVVMGKAAVIFSQVSETAKRDTSAMMLEDQARLSLDRIALAIMGANRDSLVPQLTVLPAHANDVRYRVSLGIEDGEVVWSDPEEIRLEGGGSELVWAKAPDTPDETRVVWTRYVRTLLEGELINGVDDNGNGMVDEEGLSFVLDGERVTIRLSLARLNDRGERSTSTVETTVVCRNRLGP